MNKSFPLTRLLLLTVLFAGLVSGCAKNVIPPKTDEKRASTAYLFTPLEARGAFPVTDAEAARLVAALSPREQGLSSWQGLSDAVNRSRAYAAGRPAQTAALSFPGLTVTWGELTAGLDRLRQIIPHLDARPELLVQHFRWVRLGPDFSFTGYFEPTIAASHTPTKTLTQPLYRKPPDLKAGHPYHTRHEIDRRGALRGKKLEIAYVDETDAFFLQVQGSGRLLFPDGSVTHVLYAGKNNRQYVSLGRVMKERGILPEGGVNMASIRAYLAAHPRERAPLFDENPSYVFFRSETYGPIGSMGHVLTPWVSIAVDRRVVPQGSLTMIAAPLPGPDGRHTRPFAALTLPQDSGGAIKGHRMDIFCGTGQQAEHVAGYLDAPGAVYILLPR